MPDNLPTVWPAEPHTLAKHAILRSYFGAWVAIMGYARGADELLFVDGFAGPGEYIAGEPGSPLIVIESVLEHSRTLRKPVRLVTVESRPDRRERLAGVIATRQERIEANNRILVNDPILGNCDQAVLGIIAERRSKRQPLGPALFFLDQFGYTQVPMTLLQQVFKHDMCEVFSYLNCQRMNEFLPDTSKWDGITSAYGDDSWKVALTLTGFRRQQSLIDTYTNAIRRHAGARFVWAFAMFDGDAHLIYWLVFATNSLKGLMEMKKAMWAADKTGTFRFSDRVNPGGQTYLFSLATDDAHADELYRGLKGRTLTETALEEFVLTQTPFYKFRNAVRLLIKQGRASRDGDSLTFT